MGFLVERSGGAFLLLDLVGFSCKKKSSNKKPATRMFCWETPFWQNTRCYTAKECWKIFQNREVLY